ncbi:response regulator [candidate division KSB1 bacterium]|nr:MAG: response regulator [candidate division KSB1 bacterium]MBC6947294.1 response regulator [candidate division KSB1 bacterium]MCE7941123.1 response regulator [Chlorobi bacterium CHB1]MDL1875198.1 response regulator [Cytophagia bacterium CHB2]RIK72107.1 MAG: hypothetical protein DCC62_20580 [candidate division KSB1 bacterium]
MYLAASNYEHTQRNAKSSPEGFRFTMNDHTINKCILIVDDEDDLTWSISKTLAKNDQQLEVICVGDGNAALTVLAQRRVDVVVSDIRMPGRNGLELLSDIRRDHPGAKVIIMTAAGSNDLRKELELRGASFYLEKPFEIRYLRQLIYEALDLAPPFANHTPDEKKGTAGFTPIHAD